MSIPSPAMRSGIFVYKAPIRHLSSHIAPFFLPANCLFMRPRSDAPFSVVENCRFVPFVDFAPFFGQNRQYGEICTFFGVVSTRETDYVFTTFEVLHMPRYAVICIFCAFSMIYEHQLHPCQKAAKYGIIGLFRRRERYDSTAFCLPRQYH